MCRVASVQRVASTGSSVVEARGERETESVVTRYQRHADRSQRVIEDGTLTVRIDEQLAKWSVRVIGELDDANVRTLEAALQQLDGNKAIALDLSRLDFMSAAGVEVFVRLASDKRFASRGVEVVGCSAPVERLLSTCGLDTPEHGLSAEIPSDERSALGAMGLRD
jgi:anti-anti-sigma factor